MSRYRYIQTLASIHAERISGNPARWLDYLDTAAQLYRYDFADTLLIHAQRPRATACAELETWNSKMGRWVNKGAKGIALIDDSGPRKRLRYVFDIADTHLVPGGRTPWLWHISPEDHERVAERLADTYDLELSGLAPLPSALRQIAKQYALDNLEEAMDGLSYEIKDTFLEGLSDDAVRYGFRTLLENSAYYVMARRCGLNPMEELDVDDFSAILDFNQLSVLSFVGNAVHEIVEPILRDIGREMAVITRDKARKKAQESVAKIEKLGFNEFTTLKHESEEGGREDGIDLSSEGRLSVPESQDRGQPGELREVRDASPVVSEGETQGLVSEHDADRETGEAPGGARSDGDQEGDVDLVSNGEGRGRDGADESNRPDGMDRRDEQHPEPGGRDRSSGLDLQLTEDKTEQELTEAEAEDASALSLPLFPSANQQRRRIEESVAALYAAEIPIPPEVVDEILRSGSNHARSQLRIIYNYMIDQSSDDYTDFLRREYGKGGKGFTIGNHDYSVWFDELGMQIAVGHTVEDQILDKAFLSWEEVSGRIHQLLKQGEYAPQVVLDAARNNALMEHAQTLFYMERDMAEGIADLVFENAEIFRGAYPDITERVAEYKHLKNVSLRNKILSIKREDKT